MKSGYLSQYFEGVAAKRLSAVEANVEKSNQHEFNGTLPLRRIFGDCDAEKRKFPTRFFWFGAENEGISNEGFVTWYDARANHATRYECRLYFPTTEVSGLAREGDMMFVAKRTDGTVLVIVTAANSTIENQLFWLFALQRPEGNAFEFSSIDDKSDQEVDFVVRFIFDELGIDVEEPEADELDLLLDKFKGEMPSTLELSIFARQTLKGVNPLDDADATLVAWMNQEEKLFRRLERHLIEQRLHDGFVENGTADFDGFMKFSISVTQRRKSRAGYALERHISQLFDIYKIRYSHGQVTEGNKKPDFVFPGIAEYRDISFPVESLTVLGVKTTSKDRWRQVLSEADRVPRKHLLTLEPSISQNQTDEMTSSNLQLVVPKATHESYNEKQRSWLMNVSEFIHLVAQRQ